MPLDVNNGEHDVNPTLENTPVIWLRPGDNVKIFYLIVNQGGDYNARTGSEHGNTAMTAVDYPRLSQAGDLQEATNTLNSIKHGWYNTDGCNGPVAAARYFFYTGELDYQTNANGGSYSITKNFPGIDSGRGCGSNSNYSVTMTIAKVQQTCFQASVIHQTNHTGIAGDNTWVALEEQECYDCSDLELIR